MMKKVARSPSMAKTADVYLAASMEVWKGRLGK
jgi:hypothetical protein